MKDKNDSDKNFPDDKSPEEIIDLLKSLYNPDLSIEMQDFDDFYQSIENKIEEQNPTNKINKAGREIDSNFYTRQMKLENLEKNLEQKTFQVHKTKKKKIKFSFSKAIMAACAVCLILTLAGIANFNNLPKYNFLNLEDENFDWSQLNLSQEQKQKIEEINHEWMNYSSKERGIIEAKRNKLTAEINKEKPDFSLMDKYQRDILDHEVNLKREKLNVFMEKRFVLDEAQSLELIRSLRKTTVSTN